MAVLASHKTDIGLDYYLDLPTYFLLGVAVVFLARILEFGREPKKGTTWEGSGTR